VTYQGNQNRFKSSTVTGHFAGAPHASDYHPQRIRLGGCGFSRFFCGRQDGINAFEQYVCACATLVIAHAADIHTDNAKRTKLAAVSAVANRIESIQ